MWLGRDGLAQMTEHAGLGLFGLVRYIAENDAVAHSGAQYAKACAFCANPALDKQQFSKD